jgi:hypothetical protein
MQRATPGISLDAGAVVTPGQINHLPDSGDFLPDHPS